MGKETAVDGGVKQAAGKAKGGAKAGAGKPVADRLSAERRAAFKAAAERQKARKIVTWEAVVALGPTATIASNVSRHFALEIPDYADIAEKTEELVAVSARALGAGFHEVALQRHLQRVVYAFVSSAFQAADFADKKQAAARQHGSKLRNEARDEDRSGVAGFDSYHEALRDLAARTTLQAYALMAAAEGALSAYHHLVGEVWKPYAASSEGGSVAQRSADEEMSAFDRG
jgi:hypothetical protein